MERTEAGKGDVPHAGPGLRRLSWGVLVLIAVLFVTRNLPWRLHEYDQAKQAYVPLEMVRGGAWLVQHAPDGSVATKPPLAGWIAAAVRLAAGSWTLAWWGPPLACAFLLLLAVRRAGARLATVSAATS